MFIKSYSSYVTNEVTLIEEVEIIHKKLILFIRNKLIIYTYNLNLTHIFVI